MPRETERLFRFYLTKDRQKKSLPSSASYTIVRRYIAECDKAWKDYRESLAMDNDKSWHRTR